MKHPTNFHTYSPLLELLEQRFNVLGLGDGKPFRQPTLHPEREAMIEAVADRHAAANLSDPFARARIRMHMRRGLELVSDVGRLADAQLRARQAAHEIVVIEAAA
jgi:hypothetical protein